MQEELTENELMEIFDNTQANFRNPDFFNSFVTKDRVFEGLKILAKYSTKIISVLDRKVLFTEEIASFKGLTKEDTTLLAKLGWGFDSDYNRFEVYI